MVALSGCALVLSQYTDTTSAGPKPLPVSVMLCNGRVVVGLITRDATAVGVLVGVLVAVAVLVGVLVGVAVLVGAGLGVLDGVGVDVLGAPGSA